MAEHVKETRAVEPKETRRGADDPPPYVEATYLTEFHDRNQPVAKYLREHGPTDD